MNTSKISPIAFRGWDACPVRTLYVMRPKSQRDQTITFNQELGEIAKQEGFQVKELREKTVKACWPQDEFMINAAGSLITKNREHSHFNNETLWQVVNDFKQKYGFKIKEAPMDFVVEGGNLFLGKKPDGEPFVLIGNRTEYTFGSDEYDKYRQVLSAAAAQDPFGMLPLLEKARLGDTAELDKATRRFLEKTKMGNDILKQKTAATFGVEDKNVYVVPQMNVHLDLFMRPMGYPNILVNDPEYALKNLNDLGVELSKDPATIEADFQYLRELYESTERYTKRLHKKFGNTANDVVNSLKSQGFNPIRIGAVYGEGFYEELINGCQINFLNGIAHKRPDGQLSYITNGTMRNDVDKRLEELFEKQLNEKIPGGMAKVHFVYGKLDNIQHPHHKTWNSVSFDLMNSGGGVHCQVVEEPDFDVWA